MNIKTYAIMVEGANLVVDEDASREKFEADLQEHVANCAAQKQLWADNVEPIRVGCARVFEKYPPPCKLNHKAFLTYAAMEVGFDPNTLELVKAQIDAYLHEDTDTYVVQKGPHGGVKRVADIKAAKEAAELAKK
jgi:hypothetical protein